jgi:hypothetical protein
MSNAAYDYQNQSVRSPAGQWGERFEPARLVEGAKSHLGLTLAGVAALGLGGLAWYYFGPDLRRYLKIRHM